MNCCGYILAEDMSGWGYVWSGICLVGVELIPFSGVVGYVASGAARHIGTGVS